MKWQTVFAFLTGFGWIGNGCGPEEVVYNYYGAEELEFAPSAADGHFTCNDVGQIQYECLSRPGAEGAYTLKPDYAAGVAEACRKKGFSQECIDCIGTAPCIYVEDTDHSDPYWKSPARYCVEDYGACTGI